MVGWLFLIASLIEATLTACAWVRVRGTGPHVMAFLGLSWLMSSFPLHHLVVQAGANATFIALGALSSGPGQLGAIIAGFSGFGLWQAGRRAQFSKKIVRTLDIDPSPPKTRLMAGILPFRPSGVECVPNLNYRTAEPGEQGGRNQIDLIRPRDKGHMRPVLLQIHGGAWVIGEKENQAQPLMNHLAGNGWLCFACNYRLSPRAAFPAHIVDVKRALAWVHQHAADYGGDPNFICITGGSAGGHLASLAALTANDPDYQSGFEDDDTRVAAAVPYYGIYDLEDRAGIRPDATLVPFLAKNVFQCSPGKEPDLWSQASPILRITEDAPPFFVIHGTHDSLVYVEEARVFVDALRKQSAQAVHYLELPGAQHAYDIFHNAYTHYTTEAVSAFLNEQHRVYRHTERARRIV